jgi:transposase
MKAAPIPRLELSMDDLNRLVERAGTVLSEKECEQLKAALDTLAYLTNLIEDKDTKIRHLRQLLFGASTEKTRTVLGAEAKKDGSEGKPAVAEGQEQSAPASTAGEAEGESQAGNKPRRPGHGRNGVQAYTGADKVVVPNTAVKAGQRCPLCLRGKIYELRTPGVVVRITGQAPLSATVYELQKLRCNLCGEVFTAEPPAGIGTKKYDEEAASMVAVLRYGNGVPFNRLEGLQDNLGIPLPASIQWEMVEEAGKLLAPGYEELIWQAAQGEVMCNDDTGVKILELMKENQGKAPPGPAAGQVKEDDKKPGKERTGMFTSGVVSTREGKKIALFFSGRKHAGENIAEVLKRRAADLGPPIQMCDALDRNVPKDFEVILGNCCAHGRRHFVQVADNFPQECRHVLEIFAEVYKVEAESQKQGMLPGKRLAYHQAHSGPRLKELKEWMEKQFSEHKVEPNSELGKAMRYLQNHWEKLTLFLRVAGAPLDNNIVERALKKAILSRKNSLFYKTLNGAAVGDMFMSFIHTCEKNGVNAYDYLTQLQKHSDEVSRNPDRWMPWNYRDTLRELSSRACGPRNPMKICESRTTLVTRRFGSPGQGPTRIHSGWMRRD